MGTKRTHINLGAYRGRLNLVPRSRIGGDRFKLRACPLMDRLRMENEAQLSFRGDAGWAELFINCIDQYRF
ncbi:protein of unknown function [Rhodovastum atsumiense]|nr:protein of unknown function [Rhodovastum atsumiense]